MNLSPLPLQKFFSNDGKPLVGGLLFTYVSGTTTKIATYTDETGLQTNTNPVVLDYRGEARVWLDPALTYKLTLSPADDTDPPTRSIWTVDHISAGISLADLTQEIIGNILYPTTAQENVLGIVVISHAYPPGNVLRYGVNTTPGTTDMSTAFNAATRLMTLGKVVDEDSIGAGPMVYIPPGQYMLTQQWLLSVPFYCPNLKISGYGATIFTTGSIYVLKVLGNSGIYSTIRIEGIQTNHRLNADAEGVLLIERGTNVVCDECSVDFSGVKATWAPVRIKNLTGHEGDPDYGSFWNEVRRFGMRKRGGGDPGTATYGIHIQGAANATLINGGFFTHVTDAIRIEPHAGQTYLANGVRIKNVDFEGATTGVRVIADPTFGVSGLSLTSCRIENATTFFSLEGSLVNGATYPFLEGNYIIPGVSYLNNPNSLRYTSLDSSESTNLGWHLDLSGALTLRQNSGTGEAMDIRAPTSTGGIIFRDSAGTAVIKVREGASAGFGRIQGEAASNRLELTSVAGLSASGTVGRNLTGTATFSAATTVAVTFVNAEVDGGYVVNLTPRADPVGRLWVSGQGTGGFTINNSSSTSISVGWSIARP